MGFSLLILPPLLPAGIVSHTVRPMKRNQSSDWEHEEVPVPSPEFIAAGPTEN
jgi:hypothetical protein